MVDAYRKTKQFSFAHFEGANNLPSPQNTIINKQRMEILLDRCRFSRGRTKKSAFVFLARRRRPMTVRYHDRVSRATQEVSRDSERRRRRTDLSACAGDGGCGAVVCVCDLDAVGPVQKRVWRARARVFAGRSRVGRLTRRGPGPARRRRHYTPPARRAKTRF